MNTNPEFVEFPKIARLRRRCIITEKIDGTNAQVYITDDGAVLAGSRNRWLSVDADNFGFAAWVKEHEQELLALGAGRHFGEWWGCGIQRKYGLDHKRFSMFNVVRWCLHGTEPKRIETGNPNQVKMQEVLPPCVGLVPVLYDGLFTTEAVDEAIKLLQTNGSLAAPGFPRPEGVVVFHVAGGVGFKRTIENDDTPKSAARASAVDNV